MRRVSRLLVLLVVALGWAGCGTETGKLTPKGDAPVALVSSGKRTNHAAKVANRVVVTLHPTDAMHAWQVVQADARLVQQLTEVTPPKNPGEGPTVAFLAIRAGTVRVRFLLVPVGGGREAVPIDAHDMVLTIQ